jgi:hypothetical protein
MARAAAAPRTLFVGVWLVLLLGGVAFAGSAL